MSTNKKHRKTGPNGQRIPRKPRYEPCNTVEKVTNNVALLTADEVKHLMRPIKAALVAMRQGQATELDWQHLCSGTAIGLSIDTKGIVRGMFEHFNTADLALQRVEARFRATGKWKATALWFDELDAIKTMVSLHEFQIKQLSAKEYEEAYEHAVAEIVRVGGKLVKEAKHAQGCLRVKRQISIEGATA
jgi:hypothetical protein